MSSTYKLKSDYLLLSFKHSELAKDLMSELLYSFGSTGLAATGGTLELYQDEDMIDALCWGSATCDKPYAKFSTKPDQNQSLVRCSVYPDFSDCEKGVDFSFRTYQPDFQNTQLEKIEQGTNTAQTQVETPAPPNTETNSSSQSSSSKTCPAGKYLNPLTNRCKKLPTATSSSTTTQSACPAGQYRNPETGRCKKTIVASNSVKPCANGYERNPETNRCRKIKTSTSELKPCKDGYERNPETNRCRKKSTTNSGAQYAVSSNAQAEQEKPTNLIAFSSFGVAAIAATAYTGYQFRHKIKKLIFRRED